MPNISYDEILEFRDHRNSINAVAFSPDGRRLATGGDDYLLFIFDPLTGEIVHKLEGQAPVTAICWDPHEAGRLFVGYGTGRVLVAQTTSETLSAHYLPRSICDKPVEDLACDAFSGVHRILICAGSRVELWKEVEELRWVETKLEPPELIVAHASQSSSSEVIARSGHIVNGGHSAVITYLNHGTVCWDISSRGSFQWHMLPRTARLGRSAVSSDGQLLAASNLYDGFDLYDLETRKHILMCIGQITLNIPLPVLMTCDGRELVTGTPCGSLAIFDPRTGDEQVVLDHSDDIVQALASCDLDGVRLLATGTSERGAATLVKVWRRELALSDNRPRGEHSAVPVRPHAIWHRNVGFIIISAAYSAVTGLIAFNLTSFARVYQKCQRYLCYDKKILGVTLITVVLTILVGVLYDEPEATTGLGIWYQPTEGYDFWISFARGIVEALLRMARYASIGSRVAGSAGSDLAVFLARGATDVSVLVARISVRILTGYIAYMRGE